MKKGIRAKLWDGKQFTAGWLTYDKGVISKVSFSNPSPKRASELHDLSGRCIMPGFVDTLLHGYAGVDCGEGTAARLQKMTQSLVHTGVTTALAGFYPTKSDGLQRAARNWNKWSALGGKRTHIAGWHVEGPFVAREMSGALPKAAMRKPSARAAQEFVDACGGWLTMSTLAP